MNESSKVFVCRGPDPFVRILEQVKHYFCKQILLLFFCTKFSHTYDNFYTSFSDGPVGQIQRFTVVESKESGEELF